MKYRNPKSEIRTYYKFSKYLNFVFYSLFGFGDFGFTFVELLVVVTMVGLIGAITTQVFIIGFKTLAKGEITKEIKQSGDYTLSVIETMVRNAADFSASSACNEDLKTLSIVNPDGYTTIFVCDTTANYNIASASATVPDITPTGIPLTGSQVAVSYCNFKVVCPPLSPKYVFVAFTLTQGVVAGQPTPLPENTASLEYSGTYSLGNYK